MTTRRSLLLALAGAALPAAAHAAKPSAKAAAKPKLIITVNKASQKLTVELGGDTLYKWPISTGARGYDTPSGTFKPFRMEKEHYSKEWDDAPMPYSIFFTAQGHALHGSYHIKSLGKRASHGCVRLPAKFSELLFTITHVGTPVILAGSHTDPKEVVHPGLVLGDYAEHEMEHVQAGLKNKKDPWAATTDDDAAKATAVIISHADQSAHVLENGAVVAKGLATITDPDQPLGRHVFMLTGARDGGRKMAWQALTHHTATGSAIADADAAVLKRIRVDGAVREAMQARMHPGMVLITTELPAHPDTRTGEDFVLLNTDDS